MLSSSGGNQPEPQELNSWAAKDFTSAVASADILSDSGVPAIEPSHLVTQSTHLQSFNIESSGSPSPPMGVLSVESLDPRESCTLAEDFPPPLLSPTVDGLVAEDSLAQVVEDAAGPAQEFAEYRDVSPVHQCSHEGDEEEEEQHLE